MDFICAQPDKPLFIWQMKTLLGSLLKLGVKKEGIYFLTLLEEGCPPSQEMRSLEQYATIFYYQERPEGRIYPASSKPYLFAKFWEQFPENKERHFMFVESDMLVYRIPALPSDNNWYWSDASKYLETGKYEHLLGFNADIPQSFGFHAYGKGVDADFWYKVEKDAIELYGVAGNKWICEMRSWMWNAHERLTNIISPELKFNDGYGPRKPGASLYHHLAKKVFAKRDYCITDPFDVENTAHPAFCVHDYLEAIRTAGSLFKK